MTFKQYLKKHIECDNHYIMEMSKFKREDPERFQKYHDRVQKVEEFHREDALRRNQLAMPITEAEFFKKEKIYNSLCYITGKEPTDMTE